MSGDGSEGLSKAARALLSRRARVHPDPGPRPGVAGDVAPLSGPQLGQWLSDEVSGLEVSGSLPKTLRLEGPLDRDALRRALDEIVRRHQILRTVYSLRDGEPVQRVMPFREIGIPEVDLRGRSASERPAVAAVLLDQDARRPFDLERDLLVRPLLVRLDEDVFEFQVTIQHVAFDGWSNGIFLRELGALYSAYAEGRESPLAELPLQYADFALWERAREATPAFHADRTYWKEQVAGSTTALDLPTDRPRPRPRTHARAVATAAVEAPVTARLSQLALDEGTTLFAVAFAAFQVLAARRSGRDDLILGAVSANRTRRETEDLIGSFMTILPVRARLGDAPTFRVHLRRTGEALAQAFAHQSFPFQRLTAELRPGGDPTDPLYDLVFNYRSMPGALPAMAGLRVSDFRAPHLSTTFDLHLNVTPRDGRIELELDYNPDLLAPTTAARWLDGYRTVLAAVAAEPDAGTTDLPVMPAEERRMLLEDCSGASTRSPAIDFAMDRFERSAAAFPDAPALEHLGTSISYRDLRSRIRRLTAQLRHAGVEQGQLVGLLAERSIDTITGMLAILSAGAGYVPIDPRTPARRIDAMLRPAGLRLILADRTGAPALANRPEPVLLLSDLLAAAEPPGVSAAPARIGIDDPAYVIFTSGSTGDPKGVVVPHGALASYLANAIPAFDAMPGDRLLQSAALTFDVSIKEIFLPLGTGGTLVLRPESMLDSPAAFLEQCRALDLTHAWIPTAFWGELTRAPLPGGLDLGRVRVVSFGGEAASPESVGRFWKAYTKPLCLLNCYGPTETTIACTWAQLRPGDENLGPVPIGRPLAGVTAYVLDPSLRPLPLGVEGELWIGGNQLASGYIGAPELTTQRFIPDPFSETGGARLYKTGDIVRWLPDGRLGFVGRRDFQVKVRGHRVELQDIERVLRGVPGVHQAAVIVHERDRLVAFIGTDHPEQLGPATIRDAAALELPPYMVPAQIVVLERLPLGITGKVDRQLLRTSVPAAATSGATPTTPTERVVAKVWEEVLGITGVGPADRFLDLGGHSILAMRVANRLRTELGVTVTLNAMLTHTTVADLARELDRTARDFTPAQPISRTARVARPKSAD